MDFTAIDFLQKDYEIKVKYLSDHFTRMWQRFNFFLTVISALFAYSLDPKLDFIHSGRGVGIKCQVLPTSRASTFSMSLFQPTSKNP